MSAEWRKGESIEEARRRWQTERMLQRRLEQEKEREEKQKEEEPMLSIIVDKPEINTPPRSVKMPEPIEYIKGNKKLSILICSVKDRENLLNNLLNMLKKQSTEDDDVEILVETDERKITTGAKRNILLKRARGEYVCFVDDDDFVSEDYIPKILEAIKSKADCCSLIGMLSRRTKVLSKKVHKKHRMRREIATNIFIHSLKYKTWFEKGGVYYRCPNHLNAVRREIALQVGFPDISKEEDKAYSLKLLSLLKTEAHIEGVIYFYRKV